jgi:hypothetical protein
MSVKDWVARTGDQLLKATLLNPRLLDLFANVTDSERNVWVENHLKAVAGITDDVQTITGAQFLEGLLGLGLDEVTAHAFLGLGTPLQIASTDGSQIEHSIDLKKAGRNHPGASSGVISADAIDPALGFNEQALERIESYAQGKDYLTFADLKRYHDDLTAEIRQAGKGKGWREAFRRLVGSTVIQSGEFGPYWGVMAIEVNGEKRLPLSRLRELYNNHAFFRKRAEVAGASLLEFKATYGEEATRKHLETGVPRFLQQYATMRGVELNTFDRVVDFSKQLLLERGEPGTLAEQVASAKKPIDLASIAAPTLKLVAGAAGKLICPYLGQMKLGPETTQSPTWLRWDLNRTSRPSRPLDPNDGSDATLIAAVKVARAQGEAKVFYTNNKRGEACFGIELGGGRIVTWPFQPEGKDRFELHST